MPLTDIAVRNAKPGEKKIRLRDERGLFLEVSAGKDGKPRKWWRFRYKLNGRENMLSLGVYPDVTLKDARDRRDETRRLISQGIDPAQARKSAKTEEAENGETFERIAREWWAKFQPTWTEEHGGQILRRLELNVFPWIGSRPIKDITAPEILKLARRIESRGALEMAHRTIQGCGQIFRYGIATGRCERNPAADLRGALPPVKEKHHPSITDPKAIAPLLRAMDAYQGSPITGCALRLAPLVFVRPGELRHAEWAEINIEAKEWRIPGHKMKMREQHIVPLARQALVIIEELHPLTGHGKYLFPSMRTLDRPMSENTVNGALRRLGYTKDELTGHGFRSMASTLLNEQGWNRDAIERQLAHAERDNIRAAYNYAEFLPERRKMMQAWADYLDSLKTGAKVTPLFQEATG
ncbi:tyrosine-type recombinase/integrase [Fundidesulfovibrio putealis]|uniref:tyrosine-type recombinase/integrase n=1 Tax=Fundidesulfovibrio putealis TaxID=270496 RepID=UPI00041F5F17|nr:integrase arm-type DNA-binding domain-containing protein [Fundidesulfovibrio putealis]